MPGTSPSGMALQVLLSHIGWARCRPKKQTSPKTVILRRLQCDKEPSFASYATARSKSQRRKVAATARRAPRGVLLPAAVSRAAGFDNDRQRHIVSRQPPDAHYGVFAKYLIFILLLIIDAPKWSIDFLYSICNEALS